MAQKPRAGKTEELVEEPPKIEDARASLIRVLHENEELEDELARVRAGNLRAAEVLAGPLPPPQPHSPAVGDPPPAVAEGRPTDPQQPPPPQPEPPKRPRHDDD